MSLTSIVRPQSAFRVAATAILLGIASLTYAQTATLAWDANTEPDVTGYRLSYGTRAGVYPNVVDVGNVTTYVVTGLDVSLNYYFAVQAYNSSGLVSDLSNEAPLPAAVPPGTTTLTGFGASSAYPLLAGKSVTWTAAAMSTRGPVEYKFLMFSASTGYVVVQDFSPVTTFSWNPTWNDVGHHAIQVWARTVGSPAPYEAWNAATFDVNASPVQIVSSVDFPTPSGNPVQLTASAAGMPPGAPIEYKFYLLNQTTNAWTVLRDYAASNQTTWTPTAGNYAIQVWARRAGSTAAYDAWGGLAPLRVAPTPLQLVSLKSDVTLPVDTGTEVTWTARVKGGTAGPIQYQFFRYSVARGWQLVQPWSTSYTYRWQPVSGDEGSAAIQVWVRNNGSTADFDAWSGSGFFNVNRASVQLTTSQPFPVPPGTTITLNARVADTSATFEYQYFLYTQATGTWSVLRAYNTNATASWTPSRTGTYAIQVWARKPGSAAAYEVWYGTGFINVAVGPAQVQTLNPSVSLPSRLGTSVTWKAIGVGGTASPLEYKFFLYNSASGWTLLRDYSSSNSVSWTPTQAGAYVIQVWVRSGGSTNPSYEGWMSSGYFVIQP